MPDLCTTNGPYEVKGDEVRKKEQVFDGEMRLPSIRICKVGGYSDGYRASEIADLMNKGSHFEALHEVLLDNSIVLMAAGTAFRAMGRIKLADIYDRQAAKADAALALAKERKILTGQEAYEAESRAFPFYEDGSPRRTWAELDDIAQKSWHKNPTPRRLLKKKGEAKP